MDEVVLPPVIGEKAARAARAVSEGPESRTELRTAGLVFREDERAVSADFRGD